MDTAHVPRYLTSRSRIAEPLDSVTWSRRGKKRDIRDPANQMPRRIISGPPDVTRSVPITTAEADDYTELAISSKKATKNAVKKRKNCETRASDGDAASEDDGACAPPTKKAVQGSASKSSDCGSSDDSEDDDDGFYVSVPRPRRGFRCQYWDKIGATFRDSDDNITFRIIDVCKSGTK